MRGRRIIGSPARVAVLLGVIVFAFSAAWALAVPLMGGPDEPGHVAKAAALWHGQLRGLQVLQKGYRGVSPFKADRVEVPATFGDLEARVDCFPSRRWPCS